MISIEFQDRQVTALFASLGLFTNDPRRALDDIGMELAQSTKLRLDAGVTPDGQTFKALAWATLVKRAARSRSLRRGGPLVKRSGGIRAAFQRQIAGNAKPLMDTRTHLYQSITYRIEGRNVLIVGVAPPWAAIHQFGGQAGRGHKVNIPARPFLGISAEDRAAIVNVLGAAINRAAGRGGPA